LRDEGRPERIAYEITDDGSAALQDWLGAMVAEPSIEYPEFPAALAFLMLLAPKEAARQLERRVIALGQQLAHARALTKSALESGVPRLFLIEDEYKQEMLRTQLAWVRSLIDDLQTEEIAWSWPWLRKVAAEFDPAVPRNLDSLVQRPRTTRGGHGGKYAPSRLRLPSDGTNGIARRYGSLGSGATTSIVRGSVDFQQPHSTKQ
jgi:DNA-binding PadR family transcriptional regulator